MNASALVAELHRLGVRLTTQGERLHVDAPRGALTPPLREALAKQKGEVLGLLTAAVPVQDLPSLLAWASGLSEQDLVLARPVTYAEAPLRAVTTQRVSYYAAHYLTTIAFAQVQQGGGCGCGACTREWWREREIENLGALAALREALRAGEGKEDQS